MFAQLTRQLLLLPINVTHSEITMSGSVKTTKMNRRSSYSFFPELSAAPPSLHQHQFTLGCIQMSRRLLESRGAVQTLNLFSPRGASSGLCADFERVFNYLITQSINLITIHCNVAMAQFQLLIKKTNTTYYITYTSKTNTLLKWSFNPIGQK